MQQQQKQPQSEPNPVPEPQEPVASGQNQQKQSKKNSYSSSSSSSSPNSSSNSEQQQAEAEHENRPENNTLPASQSAPDRKIRYKYCCKICKHTDKVKKACVCVVPKNQRRTQIGEQGCQTCGCNGCSKEDFISRGEDPQYKPGDKKKVKKDKEHAQFQARNGCCRKCMKAFSKSNKSCLCQVPEDVRNTKLPSSGCKICGCFGCNPQDKKDPKYRKTASRKQPSRSRERSRKKHHYSPHRSQQKESDSSKQYIDATKMNFYNVDKSILGTMMVNQFRIDPALLGFGIPQRMHGYILGKPK